VAKGEDIKGLNASLAGVYGLAALTAVLPSLQPMFRVEWLRENVWCYLETFRCLGRLFDVSFLVV
jgi:hypothetical protein